MAKPDNTRLYTFQDWLTWEGSWELINGKAYNMSPAPTSLHQFIVGELHFSLRNFFQNRQCYVFVAPFDVFFSESESYDTPDQVVQPDLSVVCSREQISKNGCDGAPSLIIEVLSPSTALKDFNEKFNLYEKYGVSEYWIVDPGNQTVHVYALEDGCFKNRSLFIEKETIQSVLYPDLSIPLDALFKLQ
ncbi:Uma2 family endonuclease [Paenibacillus barcinonensis]|uniref:Uma2 family endonuclease n=1 Tax=Paenibacillus barcinonensis TaxID=198119 RepID=UPI001C118677|nr:Uma2 family endonuclease [Paenibacillus barcinonensis]MBU5353317.1 Uma2 family endonuclease [Paenibacillus barcinonensis]